MFRNAALNGLLMFACAAIAAALIGCSEDEPMKPKAPALCVSATGWFALGWGGIGPVVNVKNCGGGGAFDWTAEEHSAWLSLSRYGGTTPGSFRITAAANDSPDTRTDTVYVLAPDVSGPAKIIVVTQAAGSATLCVSVDEWEAPLEGATRVPVEVTNCGTDNPFGWSASEYFDWISISQTSGSTPGGFSITVEPNHSGADRSGAIAVTAPGMGGSPKTIIVRQRFSLLASPRNYEVGYAPAALCAADFDGDRYPDLAVANNLSDDICVLKNKGDGTFATPRFHPVGRRPSSIAYADLDGDGDFDLAVGNAESGDVSILKNRGDGMFGSAVGCGAGLWPRSLAAADLDGDGDKDLAIVNGTKGCISTLKNRGDGSFAEQVEWYVFDIPMSLCCTDLDGDGDIDIAAAVISAYNLSCNVVVMRNRGDGTFIQEPCGRLGMDNGGYCIIAADFDKDAGDDLAIGYYASRYVGVFWNSGRDPFSDEDDYEAAAGYVRSIYSADLDGNGYPDIAAACEGDIDNVSIIWNMGMKRFSPPIYFTAGLNPSSIVCADFDGDGDVDVAVANARSYTGVYTVTVFQNFTRGPSTVGGK